MISLNAFESGMARDEFSLEGAAIERVIPLMQNSGLAAKVAGLERRLNSHGKAIAQFIVAASRQLLAPATPAEGQKCETGFPVRERSLRYGIYGARRRPNTPSSTTRFPLIRNGS